MSLKKPGARGLQSQLGSRITAARITAGFGSKSQAAAHLGKSVFQLHRWEHDLVTRADSHTLTEIAQGYGVSLAYLRSGSPAYASDGIAERISIALLSLPDDDTIDKGMAKRLQDARLALGFKSAAGAAETMGQKVATYLAHESAARRMPSEKAALYALQLKIRPEFILLADGPMLPAADDPVLRWTPVAAAEQAPLPNWKWLHAPSLNEGLTFRVVQRTEDGFELMGKAPVSIPATVLPPALRSVKGPIYGIAHRGKILLVDPRKSIGNVLKLHNGDLSQVENPESAEIKDILGELSPHEANILGLCVGSFVISTAAR